MTINLNLLVAFPQNVLVVMSTIFFEEKEEVPKGSPLHIWYQNKILNVLFRVQKELL